MYWGISIATATPKPWRFMFLLSSNAQWAHPNYQDIKSHVTIEASIMPQKIPSVQSKKSQ